MKYRKVIWGLITLFVFFILMQLTNYIYQNNSKTVAKSDHLIYFSNYKWVIKYSENQPIGPGWNYFSRDNVWVDEAGRLHLEITCSDDVCYCAEVYSIARYKYGRFIFQVSGDVINLDRNVVLGLFLYYDQDHEIDVEVTRWGIKDFPNMQYVVQPYYVHPPHRFHLKEACLSIVYIIEWEPEKITFYTYTIGIYGEKRLVEKWTKKIKVRIPMRVHIDLWLIDKDKDGLGEKPSGDGTTHVIIEKVIMERLKD